MEGREGRFLDKTEVRPAVPRDPRRTIQMKDLEWLVRVEPGSPRC